MKRAAFLVALAPLCVFAACEGDDSGTGGSALGDGGWVYDGMPTSDVPIAVDARESADARASVDGSAQDAADGAPGDGGVDAAPDAPGSPGALVLDGVDDVVVIATADGGPSESAFTAEVWFKTTAAVGNMFEVYGAGGGSDRFLYTNGGKVCFYVYGPPTTVCSAGEGYNDGAWHHAAGTLGSVGGQKVYVDGKLEGTLATTVQSTFSGGTMIRLGFGHTAFNSPMVRFAGQLDEIRMWSVERSAAEILAHFDRPLSPATAGLQGYWRLDETGSAPAAKDETSPGHDGTLDGFTFATTPWVGPGAF